MTRQTTQQTKPFLENGLINNEYLYDTRISNAKIEGHDSWHLMIAMRDLYLADIGTIQATNIENEINDLNIFDETIYLDEITVKDLIDKINTVFNGSNLRLIFLENYLKRDRFCELYQGEGIEGMNQKLKIILEQLKQLDDLGFVQKVIEKRLSNGRI